MQGMDGPVSQNVPLQEPRNMSSDGHGRIMEVC